MCILSIFYRTHLSAEAGMSEYFNTTQFSVLMWIFISVGIARFLDISMCGSDGQSLRFATF